MADTVPGESPNTAPELINWLLRAADMGASDLHLVAGFAPTVRVHGDLEPLPVDPLTESTMETLLESICPATLFEKFRDEKNLDFAPAINVQSRKLVRPDTAEAEDSDAASIQRYRANYFVAGSALGACFRVVPHQIPELSWAGFPADLADTITGLRNGLVLFTGVTGSGKTTSLAMMIQKLIDSGTRRIITVEDPVEYVFNDSHRSLVTQRSVGQDVDSFADGLKFGLRQDPDVMLVGEIRDHATAQIALSAAETGHLIFATMHTRDAKGAISRFTDLFPQTSQFEVRSQLAFSLRGVISQHLLPSSVPGEKRELALEVMFNTLPIASAIRMGKIESIDNNIQTGKADGMRLLDESIRMLMQGGRITRETAIKFVSDPRSLGLS